MLLTSAEEFAYRIKLQTQFAYEKQICWIADKSCLQESRLLRQQKKLLIYWFAEMLTELFFIQGFVEFSYKRQICWIADKICLQTTDLLNCWRNLLRDDKFAEFLTKFADIMILLIEFALTMNILTGSDRSTTLLKFSHPTPIWARLARNGLRI